MTSIEDVLLWAISEKGVFYVYGAEATIREDHPTKIDCSELVEWACGKAGVVPKMVDGARNQFAFCQAHNTAISVDRALHTRGALMFITGSNGVIHHVVFSLGDGTTMEAKGAVYGVGTFSAYNAAHKPRFDKAALIPGCDYAVKPLPPAAPVTHDEELLMAVAHDDDDARRTLIRQWCLDYWGQEPTLEEQNILTFQFAKNGYSDLALASVYDHPNAKAFRAKRGW